MGVPGCVVEFELSFSDDGVTVDSRRSQDDLAVPKGDSLDSLEVFGLDCSLSCLDNNVLQSSPSSTPPSWD